MFTPASPAARRAKSCTHHSVWHPSHELLSPDRLGEKQSAIPSRRASLVGMLEGRGKCLDYRRGVPACDALACPLVTWEVGNDDS